MTAEIALLNRRALAFAADSAVTISDGSTSKIYNSEEKIFELSRRNHIGIMLFNTLEFVGVPLDVLVRRFRSEADRKFDTCREAGEAFLAFLCQFSRHKVNEDNHLASVLHDELLEVQKEQTKRLPQFFLDRARAGENLDVDVARGLLVAQLLLEHTEIHEQRPLQNFLANVTLEDFSREYGDVVQRLINRHLAPFSKDRAIVDSVHRWGFAALKSEVFSDNFTGLVFGGFGQQDLFPSLYSVEIDGIFFGELKLRVTNDVDIDRRGEHAKIIPFAQSEMAQRFLFGLDEEIQRDITSYITKSLQKAIDTINAQHNLDLVVLGLSAEDYAGDVSRLVDRIKRKSRDEILDMVDFMPKQELAYTAEAFISLTSIKRKVSAQQESVGGPIDVALISQNEGFVWIRRKHYFDLELNPGYQIRAAENLGRILGHDGAQAARRRGRGKKAPPREH